MTFPRQALPGPGIHRRSAPALLRVMDPPSRNVHLMLGVALAPGREQDRLTDARRAVQWHGIIA